MIRKTLTLALLVATLAGAVASTGCIGITNGFNLGAAALPVPVSPLQQKRLEDQAWIHERYQRVPILGPTTHGGPVKAMDPPSDDEVMRAFERARPVQGGLPFLHEVQRNRVRIAKDLIADYVDPPRFVPLIGPAQLHHAHYKCTIYYEEVTRVGWPYPHTIRDEDSVEVIYIDHNHYHMVGNVDGGPSSNYPHNPPLAQ
ncbi:MAG: hypothetical protein KDB14_12785 [Planctomycetales bacterium]|nr:hypothetical protein [Planctomycetales bacterium]